MRAMWFVLLLLPLAGCVDESGDDVGTAPEQTVTETFTPKAPRDYPDHQAYGDVERVDGKVTVEQEGGRWRAEQEVLWVNGFDDATDAVVRLETPSAVAVGTLDAGVYALRALLWAEGDSEEEARARLTAPVHEDRMVDGRLHLNATLAAEADRGGSLILALPSAGVHDVTVRTDDLLVVSGLDAALDADVGRTAVLDGRFSDLRLDAGGAVKLVAIPIETGTWTVSAGASMQATLAGAFDLTADAATVDVDLAGADPVGEQTATHAHVRTPGGGTTTTLTAGGTISVHG